MWIECLVQRLELNFPVVHLEIIVDREGSPMSLAVWSHQDVRVRALADLGGSRKKNATKQLKHIKTMSGTLEF